MVDLNEARSLAAKVAACADLRDVRLFNVDAALDQLPDRAGGLSYSFDAEVEVQYVAETSSLIVDGKYALVVEFVDGEPSASSQEASIDEPGEHEHLAHLNFQLAALYSVESDPESPDLPEDELDAFGKTTGLLTLHPYAREFVSNMTGRMGLPPLHIGTVRIPLDKRNDEHSCRD